MSITSLLPIRDDNPTRRVSYLTIGIIVANVLLLFVTPNLGMGQDPHLREFFCRFGVVPWEITERLPTGPLVCPPGFIIGKSPYLSILTSMFLHGGLIHLGGNMLFLWVFGNNIEDTIGKARFLIFYLLTGAAAAMTHVALNASASIPTVGASGAIAGILGAYVVLFPRARVTTLVMWFYLTTIKLPAVVVLGIWFATQFLIGAGQQFGGGVAWAAHVGGFVAGALLIIPFGGRRSRQPD